MSLREPNLEFFLNMTARVIHGLKCAPDKSWKNKVKTQRAINIPDCLLFIAASIIDKTQVPPASIVHLDKFTRKYYLKVSAFDSILLPPGDTGLSLRSSSSP